MPQSRRVKKLSVVTTKSGGLPFPLLGDCARSKCDELFLTWCSDRRTTDLILGYFDDVLNGEPLEIAESNARPFFASGAQHSDTVASPTHSRSPPPLSPSSNRSSHRKKLSTSGNKFRQQQNTEAATLPTGTSTSESPDLSPGDMMTESIPPLISPRTKELVGGKKERTTLIATSSSALASSSPSSLAEENRIENEKMNSPHHNAEKTIENKILNDVIPTFYKKKNNIVASPRTVASHVAAIRNAFSPFPDAHHGILLTDFVYVAKTLWGMPTFLCPLLFRRVNLVCEKESMKEENSEHEMKDDNNGGENDEKGGGKEDTRKNASQSQSRVTVAKAIRFYHTELKSYSHTERIFRLLAKPGATFLTADDFMPMMEELLAYHPGLEFLEATPEFQEKYARTVITRIFYICNRAQNGRLTLQELERSNLISMMMLVDEEDDINKVEQYFSYEHFYVIYCKFWELDGDHDFLLTRQDLLRYGNHCLTRGIVDRIFDYARRPLNPGPDDRMTYENFCYFFLSEIDKSNPISIRYWFQLVNLCGDGVIRHREMREMYSEQLQRMESLGHEVVPFEDVMCQMCDLIRPAKPGEFRVLDFVHWEKIEHASVFFDMLFNLSEFLAYEQRDPFIQRQIKEKEPHTTPWERYARDEYARLAMEEEMRERGVSDDEEGDFGDFEEDEGWGEGDIEEE
eukprot:g2074.t1